MFVNLYSDMVYENLIAFVDSPLFYLFLVWSLVWKGLALWESARNRHIVWFVFILIISSAGILPIIYLIIYGKKKEKGKEINL